MAHESFEDEEVAAYLNRNFISVKVDREERPDVDHVYLSICQAFTGQGGWPLTVLLTPEKLPIFAGTYFPKRRMFGRIGLMELLEHFTRLWETDRNRLVKSGQRMIQAMEESQRQKSKVEYRRWDSTLLHTVYEQLADSFDSQYGGFGDAPKFPMPHQLLFLLRYSFFENQPMALQMVEKTLQSMRMGGIFDQIGFGFSRYSVDTRWEIPHFEKMLYDNALLAMVYLETYQMTNKRCYAEVAQEIFDYMKNSLLSPEGAFYAAEDADSEGEEGKFYSWDKEEIVSVLPEELAQSVIEMFSIQDIGHFEGKNVLHGFWEHADLDTFKNEQTDFIDPSQIQKWAKDWREARPLLLKARSARTRPHLDDKILTGWNGLAMAALAIGARILEDSDLLEIAIQSEAFLWGNLHLDSGLMARYRAGEAKYRAYLTDYATYIWALVELYEATYDKRYLEKVLTLLHEVVTDYWDKSGGAFFLSGHEIQDVPVRSKIAEDGAIPSGNSILAVQMCRVGYLTGDTQWIQLAEQCLQTFLQDARAYPEAHIHLLSTGFWFSFPVNEYVVVGLRDHPATQAMLEPLRHVFLPNSVTLFWDQREEKSNIWDGLPSFTTVDGKTTGYQCSNFACQAPVTDIASWLSQFASPS